MADIYLLVLGCLLVALNLLAAVMVKIIPNRQDMVLQRANNCFVLFFLSTAVASSFVVLEYCSALSEAALHTKNYFFIFSIFFLIVGARLRLKRPIRGTLLVSLMALGLVIVVVIFFYDDRVRLITTLNPFGVVLILWGIDGFFQARPRNRGDLIIGVMLIILAVFLLAHTLVVIKYGLISYDFGVLLSFVTLISLGLCCGVITSNLVDSNEQLETQATTDSMTGLMNRSYFNKEVIHQLIRARRYDYPVSLVMCDLDNFKKINDTYGHGVGDQVIVEFARSLLKWTRDGDICCRFGGEEFVLLLPHTDKGRASRLANRICKGIREVSVVCSRGAVRVTSSFGVAELEDGQDSERLLQRADDALYFAKNSGRNCVKLYSDIKETQ